MKVSFKITKEQAKSAVELLEEAHDDGYYGANPMSSLVYASTNDRCKKLVEETHARLNYCGISVYQDNQDMLYFGCHYAGTWVTSNGNVLTINPETGEVRAAGRRHGIPWYFIGQEVLDLATDIVYEDTQRSDLKPWETAT